MIDEKNFHDQRFENNIRAHFIYYILYMTLFKTLQQVKEMITQLDVYYIILILKKIMS